MTKFILLGLDGACPDVIEAEMAAGRMPHFQRLRERGVWADHVPFPSAVTPGNWRAVATGAKPWTIRISDFVMHVPGTPLDQSVEVFTKAYNHHAEFVWDAYSDRGYRAATISYPGSLPQTRPGHLAIGNSGFPSENAAPYTVAPSRALVAGRLHPVGPYDWHEHERIEILPVDGPPPVPDFQAMGLIRFPIRAVNPGFSGEHPARVYLGRRGRRPAAVVMVGPAVHVVGLREWTPFIELPFRRDNADKQKWQLQALEGTEVVAEVRLRLIELDPEAGDLLLYISTVFPRQYFSTDPSVTDRLRHDLGPYNDNLVISRLLMGWLDAEGFRDEFRLQGLWQARAALRLVNDLGFKAVLAKWHAFDKFYHFFMQKIDPVGLGFEAAQADRYERLHRVVLDIADEMVGIVLDGLADDTTLVVMSDHGLMASRRAVWVNRYLARHGYIRFRADPAGKTVVDWTRTRAYASPFLLLHVNLKGRDPEGIVEPGEEYESLKRELIELLRAWTDPQTGRHVMTDVFDPQRDGAFYGLGSEVDGDVRYFTAPGYTLYRSISPLGEEVITDASGPYLGDHGSARPTTRFGRGGEVGLFCAAGHGIVARGRRARPIFPCDVLPTLLHLAGEPPLRGQEGAVLHDLLIQG